MGVGVGVGLGGGVEPPPPPPPPPPPQPPPLLPPEHGKAVGVNVKVSADPLVVTRIEATLSLLQLLTIVALELPPTTILREPEVREKVLLPGMVATILPVLTVSEVAVEPALIVKVMAGSVKLIEVFALQVKSAACAHKPGMNSASKKNAARKNFMLDMIARIYCKLTKDYGSLHAPAATTTPFPAPLM